jgi:ABC-type antimicrobial peptide transport system permease subunit
MYYLHNSADLGFSFKNRGSINPLWIPFDRIGVLDNKIKQIPEIKETLTGYEPLLPIFLRNMIISDWDGKQGDAERINLEVIWISEQFAKFYEFELIEGDFVREGDDEKYVLINESAAKTFGWDKPVGKVFGDEYKRVVKGVVKDIYCLSPTIAAKPFCYIYPHYSKMPKILFKYEGDWKICLEKIKKIVEKELPKGEHVYYNDEEEYNKYLKSENTLLSILTILSTVCIMVCIFGFVSQISLTCEERRKEIAIRKINGATVKDILDIFFKEYLTLLAVGAAIAFPAGYIIMKRWLQNYVIQTEISAWVYVAILLALILVIIISVGGKVWRTSRENPINALNR